MTTASRMQHEQNKQAAKAQDCRHVFVREMGKDVMLGVCMFCGKTRAEVNGVTYTSDRVSDAKSSDRSTREIEDDEQ